MSWYSKLLQKYPLLTKSITGGILFSLGDIITQNYFHPNEKFDYTRNGNLFITGAVYISPALHLWYCKLLPTIANKFFVNFGKTASVFSRMALDQLLFAPVLLAGFFPFVAIVNKRSLNAIQQGIKDSKNKLWQTLKVNWQIWPAATTINFWFMPVQYQVLFANFVGLFWNIYLSYAAYKK